MTVCLAVLAMSGVLGCADTPVQVPASEVSAAVAGTDSVALTYICGNMFRIRNSSFEARSVRWDIYNAAPADTGSLWARGRDVGRSSVDFFVTSRTKGTMRLFVGTTLIATKANGNSAACPAPVDSAQFPVAPNASAFSSRLVVESPSASSPDGDAFRRTIVNVRFLPSSAASQRRAFQAQFGAQLIAVYPTFLRFRVPDLGSSYSVFTARLAAMAGHASVESATPIHSFERVFNYGARFPNDGSSRRRQDYIARSLSVWPATALRLPQAWACETGVYGGAPPRIAIYEQNFPVSSASDVSRSLLSPVVRITAWRDTMAVPLSDSNRVEFQDHGHIVAGMISASGDDSVGVAGPLWRSDLRVFTFGNTNKERGAGTLFFSAFMQREILKASPRILSLSSSVRPDTNRNERAGQFFDAFLSFKTLLDSIPGLLIVQAAGNDSYQGSYTARDSASRDVFQEALVMLRNESVEYEKRIVIVGETDVNGNRALESNAFTGLIDIYAPGFGVPVLFPSGTVGVGSGTSFAAPTVAGIAGQLLAMDSTLSAADVKRLLLGGARDSVEDSNGDNIAPSPVGNTYDVVYEADAYGSLRLLSARAGKPLCGAIVTSLRRNANVTDHDHTALSAVIHRYGAAANELLSTDRDGQPMKFIGSPFLTMTSVAPGGRSLSISSVTNSSGTYQANVFSLANGAWRATVKDTVRFGWLFGERDTLLLGMQGAVIATSGASHRLPEIPFPSAFWTPGTFAFAPDGSAFSFVATNASYGVIQSVWVARQSGTNSSAQLANGGAYSRASPTAWSPDSRTVFASVVRNETSPAGGWRFVSEMMRVGVTAGALSPSLRSIILDTQGQTIVSLFTSDEGGRALFTRGAEYSVYSAIDCSAQGVREATLSDVRNFAELDPEPCGVLSPYDPGGCPGCEIGRVLKPGDVMLSRRRNSRTQKSASPSAASF